MRFSIMMTMMAFLLNLPTIGFAQDHPPCGTLAGKIDRLNHLTSDDCCHKEKMAAKTVAKSNQKPTGQHTAAPQQETPPADGQAFCYNYKRPDKKNTPCPCTHHRDGNGKCLPVRQEGPHRCTNHCKEDMCKCNNPCKS